ncbi:MAG: Ig-like domain-containing protein, partial [Clostridiales bacterium]|nr:Ig-like domain-containing protein [Clostridiales bacterium]
TTDPTGMVSRVAENGQYRQDSMDISISASDNVRMAYVTVTNDEESEVYDYETVTDGAFTYTMSSKDTRQTLVVTATDAAGNESAFMSLVDADGNLTEASEVRYLLTTNLWIQFRSNKVLVAVSITGIAAAAAVIWWFLFGKKRTDFFT